MLKEHGLNGEMVKDSLVRVLPSQTRTALSLSVKGNDIYSAQDLSPAVMDQTLLRSDMRTRYVIVLSSLTILELIYYVDSKMSLPRR
jgi:hypothetical protein